MGAPGRPLLRVCLAGPHSTARLFEWCMAVMMVLIALTLALPGDTLERAALRSIAAMGFNEENMALIFGAVGAMRSLALYLNGHINNFRTGPKGAVIRAVGAGVGCLIMGQFSAALIWDGLVKGPALSFVIPICATLAVFEALSVYIAMLDAQRRRTKLDDARDQLAGPGI